MKQICGASFGNMLKKAKPYLLTVGLQFGMAGTYIFTMASLNRGMNRLVFIVYRNAIAALALAPFALVFERNRPDMTRPVFMQILALGFLEPVIDQGFTFLGMQYTSASFASAIMNAVPSVTLVLAVICRMEQVKIKELRSQAKVIGTLVTFAGTLLMTFCKGPEIFLFDNTTPLLQSHSTNNHKNWVTGTLFILLGCVAWSSFYILQSITVRQYPAILSLSSSICLMGALQSAVVAVVANHLVANYDSRAWAIGWDFRLFGPLYTGIVCSGIAYYIQGLVMESRGPVFLTAFSPLCMIIVTALGYVLLGERIYLGSIIGGMIIAVGLYAVVWGKGKDQEDRTRTGDGNTAAAN